jgi:hypothetical protein
MLAFKRTHVGTAYPIVSQQQNDRAIAKRHQRVISKRLQQRVVGIIWQRLG